jgi:hypothetical protein
MALEVSPGRRIASLRTLEVILLIAGCACGGNGAVPIDRIPGDKKLVELSAPETQGVCQWGEAVAREKLPPGTNCGGNPISFGGCLTVGPECQATVAQWQQCLPALLDRFARDPCQIFSLAFSQSQFAAFIEQTPGCQGLGPCGTTMVSSH